MHIRRFLICTSDGTSPQSAPLCPAARGSTQGSGSTSTTPTRRRAFSLFAPLRACVHTQSAVSHSRHVCCVTQPTCLLRDTGDVAPV